MMDVIAADDRDQRQVREDLDDYETDEDLSEDERDAYNELSRRDRDIRFVEYTK